MRPLISFIALLVLGCPNPDDGFLLSGRVVDQDGRPVANHEVRVLRDTSFDGERCAPMEPFVTLSTDRAGAFATTVYRYQQSLGQPVPRFFRVETSSVFEPTWVTAAVFRFGPVDLELPELLILNRPLQIDPLVSFTDSFTESFLDGRVAWRSQSEVRPQEDRAMETRRVDRLTRDDFVEANLLGVDSRWVNFEVRLERPLVPVPAGNASLLRGAPCAPSRPGEPCPYTDGRLLPVPFPEGTRTLTITTDSLLLASSVTVRGLHTSGEVARVLVERADGTDEGLAWQPWTVFPRGKELVAWSRTHCLEPGAFLTVFTGTTLTRGLRLRAEDMNGVTLDLLSLAEVSVR
ncbi:MAG: hypothetical protein SFW67_05740 [Myxococcaceae bacterium]|nr:hypothetical protein [Myxococcaceae bacterium]